MSQAPGPPDATSDTESTCVAIPPPPPAAQRSESPTSSWWLRRRDQVTLAFLTAVCVALMGLYLAKVSGWGRRPMEWRQLPQRTVEYRIDINTASWVELAQLPRIGRTMAERIIEDRRRHGAFRSIEDLERVPGIGPKTIEHIREYLEAGGVSDQDGSHEEKAKEAAR